MAHEEEQTWKQNLHHETKENREDVGVAASTCRVSPVIQGGSNMTGTDHI
jgi:hypothetical protein